jgi:prepilin-type N-terminal cleavage/methylation domain-containing protein
MMQAIWNRRRSDESGFTLVEMLVVVAILGILAAVAVFALGGSAQTSRRAACKTDVQTVQAASDAKYAADSTYVATPAALVTAGYLRSAPTSTAYTISIDTTTGLASSAPVCTAVP